MLRNLSWNDLWCGPLSKLCVTSPFSINFRCQIENQVSDYRLLGASSLICHRKKSIRIYHSLFIIPPLHRRGVYCFTSVLPSVQDIFFSNYWWQKSDIWSQASYRYAILWEAFLDPSDSYFLFADFVGFYTHLTYMHIFRHIFLSNYWWQKSDIWSQASYGYPISWEAFLDPSDSYFLFADFVDFYTHWTYILYMPIFSRIFLSNYWWQKSDIWSQASYRYAILWEAFLDPSDSYFLFADFGFYTHWTYMRGYHKWALAHSSSCFGVECKVLNKINIVMKHKTCMY